MASSSTVVEMPSVPQTMMVGRRWGRMWRKRIRAVPAPRVRSAAMNSRSDRAEVSVKITRAVCTQFTKAITMATIQSEGWKIAARQIASRSAGKAIIRSVKRMSTAPIQPRK